MLHIRDYLHFPILVHRGKYIGVTLLKSKLNVTGINGAMFEGSSCDSVNGTIHFLAE